MTDLVYMKTDEVMTDSLTVAEHFGKRHERVIGAIDRLLEENPESGVSKMFSKSWYEVPDNRKHYPMYRMNRDGFTLLVMGFKGKKALEWKLKYIDAFNRAEQYIRQHGAEILLRRTMTDEIRDSGENERMHGFGYKQYTDLVYKTVTGKTAKQLRDDLGLKKTDSVKEHLDPAQVDAIGKLERMIGGMVAFGLTYQAVKEAIGMATVQEYLLA